MSKIKKNAAPGLSTLKKVKVDYEEFNPPGLTEIPEELAEAFLEYDGMELRFLRVFKTNANGEFVPDTRQIAKRIREKYVPVTHTEIANMDFAGLQDIWEHAPENCSAQKDWVIALDAALFKRPHHYAVAHRDWKLRKAFEQVKGAHDMAKLRQSVGRGGDPDSIEDEGTRITLRKPRFAEGQTVVIEED